VLGVAHVHKAGVTISERLSETSGVTGLFDTAKENLKAAAADFENKLNENAPYGNTIAQAFTKLKMELLNIIGRVQAEKTVLSNIKNAVGDMTNLINQTMLLPKELAAALFNAVESITGSIKSVSETFKEAYLNKNPRRKRRGIEAFPLKSLRMRGNKSHMRLLYKAEKL
jgi:phage-related protein